MAGKLEFKEKLRGILEFAKEQNSKITAEDVEKYFEEDCLSEEQMDLVCEYLLSQNVAVKGYKKRSGTLKESEEQAEELSGEEQEYLTEYLHDMEYLDTNTQKNARMAYYLPKVADAALLLPRGSVFLGDVIQEGNVTLMLALAEGGEEAEIMESVRTGMQAFIQSQTETKVQDRKMVARVAELDEALKRLKEDLGRKVALEEVAQYLSVTEEEIEEVMKLAGEELEEDGGE